MSGHTPGPWNAWDRGIGWEVHDADGVPINSEFRETFKEADARLIAAAPDLLAALSDLVQTLEFIGHKYSSLDAARAAIAKAAQL